MRAAILLALAACFEPGAIRRDRAVLSPDAPAILAAATASPEMRDREFDQHYRAALVFYEAAKYPEAIAEFEQAYAVEPQPLLLFNIGQAYRRSGHLREALAKYREYKDKDPSAERQRVDDLIHEIEGTLAQPERPQ